MFNKNIVDGILKKNKKRRIKFLSDDLDNVVFLDFDGVINLNFNNYVGNFTDKELMNNLNRFCLENNFKIVVISSWRKYSNYKDILYNSGLDKSINILGKTKILNMDRESEIMAYLKNNYYVDKFIILDDGIFNQLAKYQVRTESKIGFNIEKYNEAIELIKNLN